MNRSVRVRGNAIFVAAIATVLVATCAEARRALTPDEARQLSFNKWPASQLAQDASGDLSFEGKRYHLACRNGTNRVVDSNAKLGNAALGESKAGHSRSCSGFEY